MKHKAVFLLLITPFFFLLQQISFAANKTYKAKDFADNGINSDTLDRDHAAIFCLYNFPSGTFRSLPDIVEPKYAYETLIKKEGNINKLYAEMFLVLRQINKKNNKPEENTSFKYEVLDDYVKKYTPSKTADLNHNTSHILLRSTISDLSLNDINNAQGATLGLSNNNLISGHAAWNSMGALGYLVNPQNSVAKIIPNISWVVVQTQGNAPETTTENLTFSVLINKSLYTNQGMLVGEIKPYYQTDFPFGYKTYGIETSAEIFGKFFGDDFLSFGGFEDIRKLQGLQYKIRFVPKLNYSATSQVDIHTSRKAGDKWLRAGGLASLEFRLTNLFDIGASFETLQNLSGNGNSANLFSPYVTYWLPSNNNIGINATYSKGSDLQTDNKTDQLTIALTVKL